MNTPVEEKKLSPRQTQVLTLMAKGLVDKQIAAEKGVTRDAVKECKRSIFRSLGAKTSAHAVAIGIKERLI